MQHLLTAFVTSEIIAFIDNSLYSCSMLLNLYALVYYRYKISNLIHIHVVFGQTKSVIIFCLIRV